MRRIPCLLIACALPAACAVAFVGCERTLPPLGEAVLVVDTDLPVPALAGTLRVDVYRLPDDGGEPVWIDSREVVREDPRDYPASFSVYSPDPERDLRVMVRLRLFPTTRVRGYRGERYFPRPSRDDGPPQELLTPPGRAEGAAPRLVVRGNDVTPHFEPDPAFAVDRLVSFRLREGVRGEVSVLLRGDCIGTQADLAGKQTCVDTENVRAAVADLALTSGNAAARPSQVGAWPIASGPRIPWRCDDPAVLAERRPGTPGLYDEEVCVPGGVFLQGDPRADRAEVDSPFEIDTGPRRVAVLPRFFADKYEVTVGRFRYAVVRGLTDDLVLRNDAPLDFSQVPRGACTWSSSPQGRESFPINCFEFSEAEAFCASIGGRLPTAAEWEYLATNGHGLARGEPKTLYPWGDAQETTCGTAIVERGFPSEPTPHTCKPTGPAPVDAIATSRSPLRDISRLGLMNLAGNLSEVVVDRALPSQARCHRMGSLLSPRCESASAVDQGAWRGSNWTDSLAPSVQHKDRPDRRANPTVGFRCVRTPSVDRAP